jgi:hypothetical protein
MQEWDTEDVFEAENEMATSETKTSETKTSEMTTSEEEVVEVVRGRHYYNFFYKMGIQFERVDENNLYI